MWATGDPGWVLPDQVTTLVNELGRTRLEVNVKVKAEFGKNLFALNVVVTIPVPETTAHADVQTKIGALCRPPASACKYSKGLPGLIAAKFLHHTCWHPFHCFANTS